MVERPQRSEDERPLHMWAPPRPHWAARKATSRQPATGAADLSGQAWPGQAAAPLAAKNPHRPPGPPGPAARTSVTGIGNSASVRLPGRAAGLMMPPAPGTLIPCPAERRIQLLRGLPGRRRLSGMRLRHPQFSHGVHQRDQVPGQRTRLAHAITAGLASHREQPRRGPQPIPLPGTARNPAMRRPGRPVIPIGGAPQHPAAGHPRRGVQRVRRRPRRVRRRTPDHRGAAAQVLRGDGGLPRRVPVNLGAFRGSDPERPGTLRRPCPLRRPTWRAAGATSANRATAHRHTSAAPRPFRRGRAGSPRTRSPHPG